MRSLRKRYLFLAALGMLAILVLAHRRVLPLALHFLDVGAPPTKSDALFVHLGDHDTRPFVAAALYRAGYAKKILIAVFKPDSRPPGHTTFENVLLNRGVPPDDIVFLGNGITNTMEECVVLLDYLQQHPDIVVTVVTTHYHSRRARWSLRRTLGHHAESLRYVSAPHDDFHADDWWLYSEGFKVVVMEYIKLTTYLLIYGNAGWMLAAGLGGLVVWGFCRRRLGPSDLGQPATTERP